VCGGEGVCRGEAVRMRKQVAQPLHASEHNSTVPHPILPLLPVFAPHLSQA